MDMKGSRVLSKLAVTMALGHRQRLRFEFAHNL